MGVEKYPTVYTANQKQMEEMAQEIAEAWMSNRPIFDLKTVIFTLSVIHALNVVIEEHAPAGSVTYPHEIEKVKPIRVDED